MCRTGGPYCYDRRKTIAQLKKEAPDKMERAKASFEKARTVTERDNARSRIAYAKLCAGEGDYHGGYGEVLKDAQTPDGGATYDMQNKSYIGVGFCYSPYKELEHKIPADKIELNDLSEYVRKNKKYFARKNHYLGLWNNPDDGNVYLDVSVRTMDASKARQSCKDNDQLAFFDLQSFESVSTDGGKNDEENIFPN